jgi:hypothetical protein
MASIGCFIEQIKRDPSGLLRHLPIREVRLQLGLSFRDRWVVADRTPRDQREGQIIYTDESAQSGEAKYPEKTDTESLS